MLSREKKENLFPRLAVHDLFIALASKQPTSSLSWWQTSFQYGQGHQCVEQPGRPWVSAVLQVLLCPPCFTLLTLLTIAVPVIRN